MYVVFIIKRKEIKKENIFSKAQDSVLQKALKKK